MSDLPHPDVDADVRAELARDRARTRRRAADLRRQVDRLIEDATLTPPDDEHDPDGATVGFERAQLLHLLADAERHLDALDASEARLADGDGGRCVACGGPIGAARRVARPVTDRCVGCAGAR